jgi:hypothetical protein
MAVAQGSCPNCGAPIEFGLGASMARVCDYCRHTIVRSDRGLGNLGKAADLVDVPSLVAVGDAGTLAGRPFHVFGRVQLDHGAGVWDEYYLGFDYGQSWGWLAYAQGEWFATSLAMPVPVPGHAFLVTEQDVPLGAAGTYRVGEVKTARVAATEGEIPSGIREGMTRHYADLWAAGRGFATLDYGEGTDQAALFLGFVLTEAELNVTQAGPRSLRKVKTAKLSCPNCGGDVPKLTGERAERVGCPYCGAVSDIALRRVVFAQERLLAEPAIPIGRRGEHDGKSYVCTAYLRRGSMFEGELYEWEEYLLFNEEVGFRWLVCDPEEGWFWVTPINLAELDLRAPSLKIEYRQRPFFVRNQNQATVRYVLGEVYWKCEVGEKVIVCDYTSGRDVVSREATAHEARWSFSTPLPAAVLIRNFGLRELPDKAQRVMMGERAATRNPFGVWMLVLVVLVVLFLCSAMLLDDCGGSGGGVHYGGGVFRGGK